MTAMLKKPLNSQLSGEKNRTGKMKEQTPSLPQKAIMTIKKKTEKKIKKRRAKKRA